MGTLAGERAERVRARTDGDRVGRAADAAVPFGVGTTITFAFKWVDGFVRRALNMKRWGCAVDEGAVDDCLATVGHLNSMRVLDRKCAKWGEHIGMEVEI